MTVILALDSSTDLLALALSGPQGPLYFDGAGRPQASESMLPEAQALLTQAGLSYADLDAIAFGAGPGAFTGLRTACAVAQGLALGVDKPVLALDSLMLMAEGARQQGAPTNAPCWVAMDARMGEIYAAAYRWLGTHWQVEDAPALYTPVALLARWALTPPQFVVGSALLEFAGHFAALPAQTLPRIESRALALASLAQQAMAQGLAQSPDSAMPHYIRDKVAQTTAERQAARAAA